MTEWILAIVVAAAFLAVCASIGVVVTFACLFSIRQERMLLAMKKRGPVSANRIIAEMSKGMWWRVSPFGAFLIRTYNEITMRVESIECKDRNHQVYLRYRLSTEGTRFLANHNKQQVQFFSGLS